MAFRCGWLSNRGADYVQSSISGDTVTFDLAPIEPDTLMAFAEFSFGDHSTQGTFSFAGPVVLQAIIGSADAIFSGYFRLTNNDGPYSSAFDHFSAPIGSQAPFTVDYHLASGGWNGNTFLSPFTYTASGEVTFVPEPVIGSLVEIGLVFMVVARRIRHRT